MKSKLNINKDGDMFYKLPNGDYHREDGPAVEYISGNKYWYLNGLLHREDGPAIKLIDGFKAWWIDGILYGEQEYKHKIRARKLKQLLH